MLNKLKIILITLLLTIIHRQVVKSQSLTGITGLLTIPTAVMPEDGEMSFGASFFNKKYNIPLFGGYYHQNVYFITMGYLPFLEVSLRLTRNINYPRKQAFGDRMPCLRLRILKEKNYSPSFVLGIHDFMATVDQTTVNFNALYAVASKHLKIRKTPIQVGLHLGYGTNWIKAAHHQFVGLFGGVSFAPNRFSALMLEYDAEKWNGGLRLKFFNRLQIIAALLNFDALSCGVSYGFRLQ